MFPLQSVVVRAVGGGKEDVPHKCPPSPQPEEHHPVVHTPVVVGIGKHLGGRGKGGSIYHQS